MIGAPARSRERPTPWHRAGLVSVGRMDQHGARPHDGSTAPVPTRPASTVMLVRAAEVAGIEVFVLQRNAGSAFAAGFYVFPGGVVDAADGAADLEAICDGPTDAECSARLGVAAGGLAYWVAAVRECFEESGILLAHRHGGGPLTVPDAERRAVHGGDISMSELCTRYDLVLDVSPLRYVAHWVTPEAERPRRFDTRFFLAAVPGDQARAGRHDEHETVSSRWVRPEQALEQAESGELMLLPPTVACMQMLAGARSVADALAAADAAGPPPRIMPTIVTDDAGTVIAARLDDGTTFHLGGRPQR